MKLNKLNVYKMVKKMKSSLINIPTVITRAGTGLILIFLALAMHYNTASLDLLREDIRLEHENHVLEMRLLRKQHKSELELELKKQKAKTVRASEEAYWLAYYSICLKFYKEKPDKILTCDSYVKMGYHAGLHRADPPASWNFNEIIGIQGVQ